MKKAENKVLVVSLLLGTVIGITLLIVAIINWQSTVELLRYWWVFLLTSMWFACTVATIGVILGKIGAVKPVQTPMYQGQAPTPVPTPMYQGQAPTPVQTPMYQGQAPTPVQTPMYQGQAPTPVPTPTPVP